MRNLFTCILLLLSICSLSQEKITISGQISDKASGEHLSGATIFEAYSSSGTACNQYGFFSISVPAGELLFQVAFVGYKKQSQTISLAADTILNFQLSSDNQLNEVQIKATTMERTILANGHEKISVKTIESLPGFLGENDVLKALTLLPGVQQGQEGSAGIFVRGGSPDQNLILLDGVPIYNATHLFGFVSVFNPEAIQSVDLYKGNFPARYGGRLSSVVDIRMKEGNKYERKTDLTLGLISSKITHEGPIRKGKSSYLISARRTLLDLLVTGAAKINKMASDEAVVPGLNFYDLNAKLNFTIDSKNQLYLSMYHGGDHLFSQFSDKTNTTNKKINNYTDVNLRWGNSVFAARWNRYINNKLFLNTSLSSGLFSYRIFNRFKQTIDDNNSVKQTWSDIEYVSKVNTNQLKLDFDWYPDNRYRMKFGTETSANYFIPGKQNVSKSDGNNIMNGNEKTSVFTTSFFIENHYTIPNQWIVNVGLRYSLNKSGTKYFQKLAPRVSIEYMALKNSIFSFSYSEMFQPLHLLTNSSIGLPSDVWVPSTENIAPERSSILTFGGRYRTQSGWSMVTDTYYKTMSGVISYGAGYSFMDLSENWEELIEKGKGRSWGIENSINYENHLFKSWINYTMSWNQRRFAGLNNGNYFPYKYDRRHDLNVGLIWKISEKVNFSAMWVYQTGQAATIAEQDYSGYAGLLSNSFTDFLTGSDIKDPNRIQLFNGYNNYRLPAFHHLDLGMTICKKRKSKTTELRIGAYNVYGRQNAYMYFPYTNDDGTRQYRQISIFPFLPSVSYRIIF